MMCLGFGGFKPILDGYTYAYMVVGDFDGRKPSFCAPGGGVCWANPNYKSVFPYF